MGITDKVSQIAGQMQDGVKTSSVSLFSSFVKLVTAFMVPLTITLIAQEMMGFETLAFVFMMVVLMGALLRLIWQWSIGAVLLFDLFCVLVALLLKLYIQVAP